MLPVLFVANRNRPSAPANSSHKVEIGKFHNEPAFVGVEKPVDFRLADWLPKGDAGEHFKARRRSGPQLMRPLISRAGFWRGAEPSLWEGVISQKPWPLALGTLPEEPVSLNRGAVFSGGTSFGRSSWIRLSAMMEKLKINALSPLIQLDNCVIDEFFSISGTDSRKVSMSFIKTHFSAPVTIGIAANYSMEDVTFENDVSLSGPGDFLEARQLHANESIICAVNAAKMSFSGAVGGSLEIATSGIRELDLRRTVLRELVLPDLDKLHGWDPRRVSF